MDITGFLWVGTWFILNVSMALLNKLVFTKFHFPYPFLLSVSHMLVCWIMSFLFIKIFKIVPQEEVSEDYRSKLRVFSVLYCLNIAFGNLSLHVVSVALSQVVRATIPGVIMILAFLVLNHRPSRTLMCTVIPIIIGVSMACFGNMEITAVSILVLLIGIFLAALKGVMTNKYLVEYNLHPIEMLYRLAPLAGIQMIFLAFITGEISSFSVEYLDLISSGSFFGVFATALAAFFLNYTNFMANKATSPLTISVAGNLKQAATIGISVWLFNTHLGPLNAAGVFVTFGGVWAYTMVKYFEQNKKTNILPTSNPTSKKGHGN
eukprot:gb/GECH01012053.1/.p1 GENE.gb/GECH01012053.1/~~gb/GECH01012053.1/.p1  ORF type:complete len:320 (+),score=53.73 gb/GECH01012053.1/:1-960(+)